MLQSMFAKAVAEFTRIQCAAVLAGLGILANSATSDAVELVRDGKAVATIVVPANPLPVAQRRYGR